MNTKLILKEDNICNVCTCGVKPVLFMATSNNGRIMYKVHCSCGKETTWQLSKEFVQVDWNNSLARKVSVPVWK